MWVSDYWHLMWRVNRLLGWQNCLAASPMRNSKALLSFEGRFIPLLRIVCLSCSSRLQVLMSLGVHPLSVWDCPLLSLPSICLECLCGLFPLPLFLALFPHFASLNVLSFLCSQILMLFRVEEQKDEDYFWEVKDLDPPKGVIMSYGAVKGQKECAGRTWLNMVPHGSSWVLCVNLGVSCFSDYMCYCIKVFSSFS